MNGGTEPDFRDGFLMGLRAALFMTHGRLAAEIRKLEERSGRPVDGEAEWRSWNVNVDLGIVELMNVRKGNDRRRP